MPETSTFWNGGTNKSAQPAKAAARPKRARKSAHRSAPVAQKITTTRRCAAPSSSVVSPEVSHASGTSSHIHKGWKPLVGERPSAVKP